MARISAHLSRAALWMSELLLPITTCASGEPYSCRGEWGRLRNLVK